MELEQEAEDLVAEFLSQLYYDLDALRDLLAEATFQSVIKYVDGVLGRGEEGSEFLTSR